MGTKEKIVETKERRIRTKDRITQKALQLFNQNGIEYVGMRELAVSLDLKIGNITYYFPTKDDLVSQLASDLSALNAKTLTPKGNITMLSFLEMTENAFRNQQKYRCLFLSFVHLIKQNPAIAGRYKTIEKERVRTFFERVKTLKKDGYLILKSDDEINYLASMVSLISRFWISEAAITSEPVAAHDPAFHYTRLIGQLFRPYATKAGQKGIDSYFYRRGG